MSIRVGRFLGFGLAALLPVIVARAEPIPLLNPGFENGQSGWAFKDKGISLVSGEAARTGSQGLRINDEDIDRGSDVACARFVTEPGKRVTARCWARLNDGEGIAIYLRFFKGDGTSLNKSDLGNEISAKVPAESHEWQKIEVSGTVPEEAIEGEIWIHSYNSALVKADIDDFELEQVGP